MKITRYHFLCVILILKPESMRQRSLTKTNKYNAYVREEYTMKELELKYGCNPNQKPSKNLYGRMAGASDYRF